MMNKHIILVIVRREPLKNRNIVSLSLAGGSPQSQVVEHEHEQ